MRVLLIGSGGREHALAYAIAQSPDLTRLVVSPGNAGIAQIADCISLDLADHSAVAGFCREQKIDLVVVGPEGPLVAGIADDLQAECIAVFGPSRAAARLEGSKDFTKILCAEAGIPTAASQTFDSVEPALAHVRDHALPVVIKADGLAAGKGVTIAEDHASAQSAIVAIFDGAFGEDGARVVIEEFLTGEEASFFALTDGTNILALATAQDHKRAFDGDKGPNTGGMGAYSPAPVMTPALVDETMARIIEPTVRTMAARGTPFCGVLYAGLMITPEGPKLIEYNVRFGDPECQALMVRLDSDLLALLNACIDGTLGTAHVSWRPEPALCVVMAAQGYPGAYKTGEPIGNIDGARTTGVEIFHAGTAKMDGQIVSNGGRVLGVTASAATIERARERAYRAIDLIDWPGGFCRTDIGWRAMEND
ncbi:MAG: phosphoribosylamine--glycine ligase [Alphaproteobacteria bacterium]